jgi:predicted DNA-binding transcriptional regulator AlpA
MANTFKNASIAVNTTPGTIIYTVPLGRTAVVHTLVVSNISANPQNVTIQMVDASASTAFRLVSDAPIPAGGSLSFPKPINLESGDSIRIVASTVTTLEAFASILEIS